MEIVLNTLEDIEKFAYKFASLLKGNELVALSGSLGAGKTTFTKYVGHALKIKEEIISPTFNIIKIYDSCKGPFYHVDAYRLENLGYDPVLDDYIFDDNAIKFIEWYNFLDEEIFDNAIKIHITELDNNRRLFKVEGLDICID